MKARVVYFVTIKKVNLYWCQMAGEHKIHHLIDCFVGAEYINVNLYVKKTPTYIVCMGSIWREHPYHTTRFGFLNLCQICHILFQRANVFDECYDLLVTLSERQVIKNGRHSWKQYRM